MARAGKLDFKRNGRLVRRGVQADQRIGLILDDRQ